MKSLSTLVGKFILYIILCTVGIMAVANYIIYLTCASLERDYGTTVDFVPLHIDYTSSPTNSWDRATLYHFEEFDMMIDSSYSCLDDGFVYTNKSFKVFVNKGALDANQGLVSLVNQIDFSDTNYFPSKKDIGFLKSPVKNASFRDRMKKKCESIGVNAYDGIVFETGSSVVLLYKIFGTDIYALRIVNTLAKKSLYIEIKRVAASVANEDYLAECITIAGNVLWLE